MPTATRRQALTHNHQGSMQSASDDLPSLDDDGSVNHDCMEEDGEPGEDGEGDEQQDDSESPFPPPGLKEISSLASWTLSTAKPGNGVAALRSPDMSHFWQSDGPQPHLLSIHFFKLVSIVHMRIFLDFESDESYTPTKIQFLAGMGAHDLQEFAEMEFEQPTGWIEVDFSNVGPMDQDSEDSSIEMGEVDWSKRPVLRTMLVQVKILENHQNGKDTHLRGVQIFARDESQQVRRSSVSGASFSAALPKRTRGRVDGHGFVNNIRLASWMQEPDLR